METINLKTLYAVISQDYDNFKTHTVFYNKKQAEDWVGLFGFYYSIIEIPLEDVSNKPIAKSIGSVISFKDDYFNYYALSHEKYSIIDHFQIEGNRYYNFTMRLEFNHTDVDLLKKTIFEKRQQFIQKYNLNENSYIRELVGFYDINTLEKIANTHDEFNLLNERRS